MIVDVATIVPPYVHTTAEIVAHADEHWLRGIPPEVRRAALKIFEGAQIERRAAALPLQKIFGDLSFEERNNLYIEAALSLSEHALTKVLQQTGVKPEQIDYLITTSCTGFMIPSVDAYLVNRLGLRQDVVRLPVTEMGCAAGISALIYARQFMRANPQAHVAVVAVEIPSITFQKNDFSMENLVSTAIFADGAAAVVLGPEGRADIVDADMYHFPESTHLMGYRLKNSGLKIVLDRDVPDKINEHFPRFFFPFLERNGVCPEGIQHYMFHPGGKKIINSVEDFMGRYGKDISVSKQVLQQHGNMSSATVLFILEKILRRGPKTGDKGYMLAFGPGFSAQSLLLEWL